MSMRPTVRTMQFSMVVVRPRAVAIRAEGHAMVAQHPWLRAPFGLRAWNDTESIRRVRFGGAKAEAPLPA